LHILCITRARLTTSLFPYTTLFRSESDRLLIQRIRANDQSAWNDLFERYKGRLGAYVRRRLRDHASVDDVVQNTFEQVVPGRLRSEEHTSELQSLTNLVCRLLLAKK